MQVSVRRRWTAIFATAAVLGATLLPQVVGAQPARADYGAMSQPVSGYVTGTVGTRCVITGGSAPDPTNHGVDIGSNSEDVVVAAYPGQVVVVGSYGDYGQAVTIAHTGGYTTVYGHLKLGSMPVYSGQWINKGDIIGIVGNTGNSYSAHLHFELRNSNGTPLNLPSYSCDQQVTRGASIPMDVPGLTGTAPRPISEIGAYSNGWQKVDTGGNIIQSDIFSAVDMGTGWGDIFSSSGGMMMHTFVSGQPWITLGSGLPLNATSISAVDVGQDSPHVYAVENGQVVHIYADATGWHKGFTGVTTSGKLSAVKMGDGSVQIMINEGNVLSHMWANGGQWIKQSTGRPVGDQFDALDMGGPAPQVMTLLNGQVHQIFSTGSAWVLQSTGVAVSTTTSLAAVNMGGGYAQVFTVEGGGLYQTRVVNGAWTRMGTGVSVNGPIDALNLGGSTARLYTTG